MRLALAAVAVAAALLLTGCGSGDSSSGSSSAASASPSSSAASPSTSASASTSASTPAGAAATIKIEHFSFGSPLTVKPGTSVRVVNDDSQAHTVTEAKGLFDSGNVAGDRGTASVTAPKKPGTYQLTCRYHANMHGTLVVSTAAAGATPSASASDDKGGN